MADNTVKIDVGIDTSALADNLSQVKSLFQESTESITGLWVDVGEKITEALLKIVSQAAETGQQSKEQMGGAASSVASFAEQAGGKLNVYLSIALLVIKAAQDLWELHKRLKEEAYNTKHQMAELALTFDSEAHSVEIANLRLDDQISKLRGGVSHNKLKEAILEAKDAADKLIKSIEKALEEENKILEKKVIGGLWEAIFGGGALTDQFKEVTTLMYEWRAAQDNLASAQNKLLDAKTKAEKDAAEQEVAIAKKAANDKLTAYRNAVKGELDAEVDKLAYFKKLQKAGYAGPGLVDEYTQRVALLTEYYHSLEQVDRIEKDLDANADKKGEVARLETRKEQDQQTTKSIDGEKRLAEERVKTSLAGLEQEKARIGAMREDTVEEVGASITAETNLATKENTIKKDGLTKQLTLLDQWWAQVDQKNKANADAYNNQKAIINEQQLQQEAAFNAQIAAITDEGEKKKADIRIRAAEKDAQDREKAQDRRYAIEKAGYDKEIDLVKSNALRGLITAQQERDQLKAIYDRELEDLRTKVRAQLAIEEQLRQALAANGAGPGSPQYEASLARSRQLQDELTKATADFGKTISQLDTKIKGLSLTGQQFTQKLRTDMLNTINQLKVAWQGMIDQMNSGFISSFNKMLETGKGFGQGMIETFGKMAESLIDMFLKIALEWIESQVLMMVFGKTKDQTDSDANVAKAQSLAAVAAEGAFAYYSAIFPPLAAGMASAQYAQGLLWAGLAAFELGGVVPQTGLALVHKGETILPASMSGKGFDGAGGGLTVVVNHSVNAVDADSFQKVIRRHGNLIGNEVARVLKRRGISSK